MALVIVVVSWIYISWEDRHPGYSVDLQVKGDGPAGAIRAGFGKMVITPTITDTWNDANGDAKYNEEDGDTYNDVNGNGAFDAVWIAGFHNGRPANGIHDELWARTMVVDDGQTRIALVILDAVGFMHDDVVDIRKRISSELGIHYVVIASTHTHESNDVVGIWGKDEFNSGVDEKEMEYLKSQTVKSIEAAVAAIRPAKLLFSQDLSGADTAFVKDTRMPLVKAPGVKVLHAIDAETGETLGTVVNWANHPETLWSKNLLISADFPHYIREAVEGGVREDTTLLKAGLGGITLYLNGAIGGLMAPHPSLSVRGPFTDTEYAEPSFEKAKAIGDQIGLLALTSLEKADTVESTSISLRAKTITLPLKNTIFRIAGVIGLLNRGGPALFMTRSEVAAFAIGPATFLSIPGEIYPEILYGGVENPEGRDFETDPVEVPPIHEFMRGTYDFYIGLSNDEIGYIIPKSEWDEKEPYLYGKEGGWYGEVNSIGPETGPLIYKELVDVLEGI